MPDDTDPSADPADAARRELQRIAELTERQRKAIQPRSDKADAVQPVKDLGEATQRMEKQRRRLEADAQARLAVTDESLQRVTKGMDDHARKVAAEKAEQVEREEQSLAALRLIGDNLQLLNDASTDEAQRSRRVVNQNWWILAVAVAALLVAGVGVVVALHH